MNLFSILPRKIGESESDCASILNSLIMGAHLDRARARQLGWRGVRSTASSHPSWTCRLAGSDCVFGIHFEGEKREADHISGVFYLYVFPPADSPLLDIFPLRALEYALSPRYEEALRDFSAFNEHLAPFRLGALFMNVSLDGQEFDFSLEAEARHKVIALDGIKAPDGWLVAPGSPECDVPAFRLFLRLFSILVATAEIQLNAKASIWRARTQNAISCYNVSGEVSEFSEDMATVLSLGASFGGQKMKGQKASLPRFANRNKQDQSELPLLHILTGFLGSGKTTFLRRWLDFLHGRERYTGVIQNEFGKIDLDSSILQNDTLVEALDEGCVCCSLSDSLRPGLARIISQMPAKQFILETTGLANPANILEALKELDDLVKPGLVLTVVDTLALSAADDGDSARDLRLAQIKKADVLILNKTDMISAERLESIKENIAAINPRALLFTAVRGAISFASLDALIDAFNQGSQIPHSIAAPQTDTITHDERDFTSRGARFSQPVDAEKLGEILRSAGKNLVRAKGVIEIGGKGACIVQYAAGHLDIEECADTPVGLALIGADLDSTIKKLRSIGADDGKTDEHISHGRLDDVAACACLHNGCHHHH